MSELDDDSLWKPSDGPERDSWNARDLVNARIDHNLASRNAAGLEAAGPGVRKGVIFTDNLSRGDEIGIAIQNSTDSAVLYNEIGDTRLGSITIGGGNTGLVIHANRVHGSGAQGVFFVETFIDRFPIPSREVTVTQNELTGGALAGMVSNTNNLAASLIAENTASDNGRFGINLFGGNTGNVVRENTADRNGMSGINIQRGAADNTFEQNSMHDNGTDARDLNPLVDGKLPNDWINNDCVTDFPAGKICGAG